MRKKKADNSFLHTPEIQSGHAVLLSGEEYILQLRDTKLNIAAPGQWSLFGGLNKSGETPLEAISREIQEELSIQPTKFQYLWFTDHFAPFEAEIIRSWFFCSDVSSVWADHKLLEGQAVGIFNYEDTLSLKMPTVMRTTIERFHNQAWENGHI